MKAVPDYVNISELSIPGTHDSCARHNGHSFGFAKCQDKGLREQLNKGIRFIDIRVKRTKKKGLCVFHGEGWKGKIPLFVDQEKHFREVLEICHSFLSDNPSETILMSLKEEDVFSNLDDFKHQFNTAVNRMGESLAGRFLDSTSSPILRDARGKIVLFKRSGTQHVEISGIDITDFENKWRPNPGEGKLWYNVSDRYELYFKGFNMNDKKEAVREHIQAAQDHPGSIFFTFLSAFKGSPVIPGSLTPKEVANSKNGMNLYATKLFYQMTDDSFGFRTPSVSRKFGIIAMDFFGDIMPHPRSRHYRPTCEMVARIIISNPGVSSWW